MRRYRRAPVSVSKPVRADDDDWYLVNEMATSITVYEPESHWQTLQLLDADGRPIEVYTGPDPIGFVHFEDE